MLPARQLLGYVFDSLYPRQCAVEACGSSHIAPQRHLCWECRAKIQLYTQSLCRCCGYFIEKQVTHDFVCGNCLKLRPHFDKARSAGRFDGVLRELVHNFKYNNALWLKQDLVDLLEGALQAHFEVSAVDLVLPVPLHSLRKRERSYNQADLLGRTLAKRINRSYDQHVLVRQRATGTQTSLNAAQRRRNVLGAFHVRRPAWVAGRVVLVVDDVMTTGATLSECARMLKKAGARQVWVLTVARGL